jgi:hypothetical protein
VECGILGINLIDLIRASNRWRKMPKVEETLEAWCFGKRTGIRILPMKEEEKAKRS